MQPLEIDLEK